MPDDKIKGPASYFPSIEKEYGRPIAEWKVIVRAARPVKHMELVAMLKEPHSDPPPSKWSIPVYVYGQRGRTIRWGRINRRDCFRMIKKSHSELLSWN